MATTEITQYDQYGFEIDKEYVSDPFYTARMRHRCWNWLKLVNVDAHIKTSKVSGGLYWRLANLPEPPSTTDIKEDLARTFPGHKMFEDEHGEGRAAMYRILKAYCLYEHVIGYCQGMNFIAGMLLIVGMQEEEAFWTLCSLMQSLKLSSYYEQGMPGIKQDTKILRRRLRAEMPEFMEKLNDFGIPVMLFTSNWFLSLYTDLENFSLVLAIWDHIFLNGRKGIIDVAFYIIEAFKDEIMATKRPEEALPLLLNLPKNNLTVERVFPTTTTTTTEKTNT